MNVFVKILGYKTNATGIVLMREKLLINFICITSFFSLFYIAISMLIGYQPGVYVMSINFVLFLSILFLFVKKKLTYNAAAHLYIANCALVAIMFCTYFSGGLYSPVLPWFILIPVVSLLLMGMSRSTWIWFLLVLFIMVVMGVLRIRGFVFPVEYNRKWIDFFTITCIAGLTMIIYIITMVFERARETAWDKLATRNKEMTDSIHYAKRIQDTVLPPDEFMRKYFPESFVFYQSRDIVSGDFYWACEKENFIYLAFCDCTGKGVPGAFMSLITSSFMSEALNERQLEKPNEVFNYVRRRLIQNVSKEGTKDGMDGVMLCINKNNGALSYAAANCSPVLVRQGALQKLPRDKMPVGIGNRMESFNLYTIAPEKGDMLYLYTDGFTNQFGGPKGKKFSHRQLYAKLQEIHQATVEQQLSEIHQVFNGWKGEWEQIDDVSMIGIRY